MEYDKMKNKTIQRNNFIILTGGPSSGKTSIIEKLKEKGYLCIDEVGRQIIQEQLAIGGNALHSVDR
jgi:predicted ATPase